MCVCVCVCVCVCMCVCGEIKEKHFNLQFPVFASINQYNFQKNYKYYQKVPVQLVIKIWY